MWLIPHLWGSEGNTDGFSTSTTLPVDSAVLDSLCYCSCLLCSLSLRG